MNREESVTAITRFVCRSAILTVFSVALAWGVVPVAILGERADLVMTGRLLSMTVVESGAAEARLRAEIVLKGQAPASSINAELPASPIMKQNAGPRVVGSLSAHGLWFLKLVSPGVYEILPIEQGDYTEMTSFLPVPESWVPQSEATLSQNLLAAVLVSYQSVKNPTRIDEGMLLVSLDAADRGEALSIADKLMSSPFSDQRVIGFAAAIRRSSDEALVRLGRELETLRQDEDHFFWITFSLVNYYKPHGSSSIEALHQLIELRSGAPGLDAAIGGALKKIGTREVLPEMLLLLDSPDPSAKRRACWYFHYYSALAGADGNINRSGNGRHPFHTEETRLHSGRDTSFTVDEHAAFWKSWWAQNREKLGFVTTAGNE